MSVSVKYIYKGFVPLSRLTQTCKDGVHAPCKDFSFEEMSKWLSVDEAKKYCCLCSCHFPEVNA